jgi:DNA invertase Pin-like site-specific DNA recombinase
VRVSTSQRGRSGLGIEAQREALAHFAASEGFELLRVFVDIETGKGADALERRPQLAAAPQRSSAATLLSGCGQVRSAQPRRASFPALWSIASRFLVAELGPDAALAENERAMIATRIKAALAGAKARGVKLGGPKLAEARKAAVERNVANANQHAANVLPVTREKKRSDASLHQIADALNARGIATPRDGR